MIFNKNNNGSSEIHTLTGMYYANNNFSRIETNIRLETRTIINFIGKETYKLAKTAYDTGDTEKADLVRAVQTPIALLALYHYAQENIISHEDTGRTVKLDNNNEKLPWEWMLDRDDAAMLRKAYIAIDTLLDFLEEKQIPQWLQSENRQQVRSVFFSGAKEFNAVYPIDQSQRFFYELLPFIAENQQITLPQAMGETLYADFLAKYQANALNENTDRLLLLLIRRWLALQTIYTACLRFALSVFPEGISQRFLASSGGRHASKEPADETVRKYATLVSQDADRALNNLKMAIKNRKAADLDYPIIPNNNPKNGYFRT